MWDLLASNMQNESSKVTKNGNKKKRNAKNMQCKDYWASEASHTL